MALNLGELVAFITAEDRGFRRTIDRARRSMSGLADGADRGLGRLAGVVSGTVGTLGTMAAGAARAALAVGAVGSAALAAAPLLAPVGAALLQIGSAALAAAPAVLAMGAAFFIAKTALTAIFAEGTAARKALEPLGKALTEATEAGSKAAAKGIKPLAEQLRKVAQPAVTAFMVGVGRAANRVQKDFLNWAKSADGINTLWKILMPIRRALQDLAPHVSKLGIAFTRMLGRIMGVSAAVGTKGLAGAIDWLTKKLNGINAATVSGGLAKLKDTALTVGNAVRTVAGWISKLVAAYRMYTTEFKLVADAVSVAAIIFGGPVVAAIGAAGLIIRHFDQLKAAWERLKAAFSGGGGGGPLATSLQNLKAAAAIVLPAIKNAFMQLWQAVAPTLKDIWRIITTELVPAISEFARAMAPVVAWMISVLLPVVKTVWTGVLNVIKGALNIIVGVIKVFTGILTGDWSKVWSGLQSIAKGAWQIIWAVIKTAIGLVWATIKGTLSLLRPLWDRTWQAIRQGVTVAINAVKGVVTGGMNAVRSAVTAGINAAKSLFSRGWNSIRSATTSGVSRLLGIVRGIPGRIRSALGSLGSLLYNAGRNVIQGLINGIRNMIGRLASQMSNVASTIRNHLPFSPAKEGPLSGDGNPVRSGLSIARQLASGLDRGQGTVAAAMASLTSGIASPTIGVTGTGSGRAGTATAARPPVGRLIIDVTGADGDMKKMIRKMVRIDGRGDVQVAFARHG